MPPVPPVEAPPCPPPPLLEVPETEVPELPDPLEAPDVPLVPPSSPQPEANAKTESVMQKTAQNPANFDEAIRFLPLRDILPAA